jgi:hypothetical protein
MRLKMTLNEWLNIGIDNGWCSMPVCATHDGLPGTIEENSEWEEGGDPCQVAVRIWE